MGDLKYITEAWATDEEIRYKAASGGVVTSIAIYLLEQKAVDAIFQVGVRSDSYLYNELKVSRTKLEIMNNAQSRYAPAPIFDNIKQILDSSTEIYGFIGKPCDIAGLKNFMEVFPEYKHRIKIYISIFCAGMPSYNASIKAWKLSGKEQEPVSLKYRGDGWPGYFTVKWADNTDFKLDYNESWGKVLGRELGFRCKICPDGIGMLADIAVGDSWNTKNGYPDFTEGAGKSFVMVRTALGSEILKKVEKLGFLYCTNLEVSKIKEIQNYQFQRRKLIGWRYLPVQICTGFILNFKGLGIMKLALTANLINGLQNMLGTLKRMIINGK